MYEIKFRGYLKLNSIYFVGQQNAQVMIKKIIYAKFRENFTQFCIFVNYNGVGTSDERLIPFYRIWDSATILKFCLGNTFCPVIRKTKLLGGTKFVWEKPEQNYDF